jgi:SMC interacting uncharacterized protein involved in chromosome segregation
MKDYRTQDFRSYESRTQEYRSSSPRRGEYLEREYGNPRREMISQELDEHTSKIKELLKSDIAMLEEENCLLKVKLKVVPEMEDKIETTMRQKSELLAEN